MFLWLFLSLTALVCACAAVWAQGSRARRLLAALPTYPQLPLFGNILYFIGGSEHIFMRIIDMTQKSEEKNLPFVLWIGPLPALLVHDPEDVKIISNVFVEKPYLYSFAREWVGDGLVTAAGPIWKKNIKKLAGTFTASIVDGYQDVFNAQAQNLVQRLKTKAGSEPFDAMHDLAYTTLEAICQTALGTPKITSRIVTEEYYQAFNKTLQLLMSRGVNIFYHPEWVYHKTSAYRELKKSVAILHNVSETVLTQRKKERSEKAAQCENQKCNGYEDTGKSKCKTLIDILLDLSEEDPTLTEKQIKSELDTIIVGGQETVATTLFFTLLMIGCKKDIQEKLHKEISSIFGDSKRPIQKEDLDAMRYCEATIMETLRLFPPIPVVMRHADRDLVLKSYTIPKGAGCGINALGAGRSKRNWGPDAEVYNPERWLDQTTQGATFLPFSYGRRACIGKKYALQILKTILASCVRELEFKSNADQLKFKYDLVIRPTSGHLMQVSCRDDQRPATFIM